MPGTVHHWKGWYPGAGEEGMVATDATAQVTELNDDPVTLAPVAGFPPRAVAAVTCRAGPLLATYRQ